MTTAPLPAFAGYGIEIEYAIVDRQSLDVRPLAGLLLRELAHDARQSPAADWSNELVQHVVELKNPQPATELAVLPPLFKEAVRDANACLALHGACLMPAGMHPWMDPVADTRLWDADDADIYAAFDRIFDCRRHGWANLQSMHVNLPFADDAEFARLHAAVRAVLPIIPALAASSPFREGAWGGALDSRLVAYRDNSASIPEITGAVIPDNATTRAEYESTVLDPMYRAILPHDPAGTLQHEWLNARGAIARFDRHALEIRLCDTQECPRADLAIAAAIVAVVRMLYDQRSSDVRQQRDLPTALLASQLEACMREADAAPVPAAAYRAVLGLSSANCTASDAWRTLIGRCAGDIEALDPLAATPLATIAAQGPLARRIRRALGPRCDRDALRHVYARLCRCLADDELFSVP